LIFEELSIAVRNTDVLFAEANGNLSDGKRGQNTHPKIKVRKTGGGVVSGHHCLVDLDFKGFACGNLCFHHKGQARNRTFVYECARWS
jgi:hypothetical protein